MRELPSYLHIGYARDIEPSTLRRLYRLLEIFPGAIAWLTLALMVVASAVFPVGAAIFIIAFDTYWLFKTIFLSLHLRVAFTATRKNQKIDWFEKLRELPRERYSLSVASWRDLWHVVILPFYKEGIEVVQPTVEAIARAGYPKERLMVVLAQEERAGAEGEIVTNQILKEFAGRFFKLFSVVHPKDIPGEMAGKGSNIAWAAKRVKEEIDGLGIPYENVIVSAFDIDTIVPKSFFGRLAYLYLTTPNPTRASFQPIPLYVNNIWEAPALARVISFSATFWHMMQQERSDRATTFSSHSMSFKALEEVGFWQKNMVNEDSRIFWQCFLYYNGDYRVVPMHYPVYMDANVGPTFLKTMAQQYKQQRRWGYGVENIPYFLFGFLKNKAIPFFKKLRWSFLIVESFHSWATNALLIFVLGWLPLALGGDAFNATLLAYNLPRLTRWIMTAAMVGMVTSAYLT
ncbi:glycosyltransferase family 2 protein, partial [Candidatus Azambacteria bacterium]|nr:glycosyltransferase family 2 protein [Candidatus Azambacteria bacterium]